MLCLKADVHRGAWNWQDVHEVVLPTFFHSKNVPNSVKEKSHLVVFPSEEHYHCEIHAERGPHEMQARDLSPVIYN